MTERILVLGAATSGFAAARLARRRGHSVTVYDSDDTAAPAVLAEGISVVTGSWDPTYLSGVDLVVTSPGFPERSAPITDALEAGVRVWSEIELAWRQLSVPVVAVTGTNGKTTVTSAISDLLTASGLRAPTLGNIGIALSDAADRDIDVAVVEVSSFQLRFIETFRPEVAVVTNVAPDHLDWHGSFPSYFEAKARIVEHQGPGEVLVYDAEDDGATRLAGRAPGRTVPVSAKALPDGGAGVQGDELVWPNALRLDMARLADRDPVLVTDLLLAGAAALEMGADPDRMAEAMTRFRPGAHRRQLIAEVGGVRFIDDSKATNPHAAAAAVRAYPSVVLIAGGRSKGLDLSSLVAEPTVKHVVAIGEAAPDLLRLAGSRGSPASSMEEAVEIAVGRAAPGDVVLLAPGCASFDMFRSYAERGDAFARAVRTIMSGASR